MPQGEKEIPKGRNKKITPPTFPQGKVD